MGWATLIWQVGAETSWIFYRIYKHDERLDSIDDYCISKFGKKFPMIAAPAIHHQGFRAIVLNFW